MKLKPKKSKRPTRKPELRDRPMTTGNALKELLDVMHCECPDVSYKEKVEMKQKIHIALLLDAEFHSKGKGPSKNECEWLVYGKRVPDPKHPEDEELGILEVPKELEEKFPETVRTLNGLLG